MWWYVCKKCQIVIKQDHYSHYSTIRLNSFPFALQVITLTQATTLIIFFPFLIWVKKNLDGRKMKRIYSLLFAKVAMKKGSFCFKRENFFVRTSNTTVKSADNNRGCKVRVKWEFFSHLPTFATQYRHVRIPHHLPMILTRLISAIKCPTNSLFAPFILFTWCTMANSFESVLVRGWTLNWI